MRRLSGLQVVAAFVLLALGFLFVVQLRASRSFSQQPEVPTRNVYAMATLLRKERDSRVDLERALEEMRRRLTEYERSAVEGKTLNAALRNELESLRAVAGMRAMRGPGVVVTLRDAAPQPPAGSTITVTYQDLVSVINELWAAGSEAVAVNGQRVMATTGFGQVGGTVVVNLQRLRGPFAVVALGDASTIEGALTIPGGLVEGLRALGLSITITRNAELTVPAYRGTLKLEYAKPAEP